MVSAHDTAMSYPSHKLLRKDDVHDCESGDEEGDQPIVVNMTFKKADRKSTTNISKDSAIDVHHLNRLQLQDVLLSVHGLRGVYTGHPVRGWPFRFGFRGMR